jgi:HAD superfamily hydrolase (TIGR01549 family)
MTPPVEAVLFDVDDTVCEYHRTIDELLSVAFDRAGIEPFFDADEYVSRYNDFADESDDVVDLWARCFAAFARERGRTPETGREVARAYAAERDYTAVRFLPGAKETLERLHGTVPLAAVTNGAPEMQSVKLRTLGADDYFETVVHGGYDAPAKPSPEPFQVALDTLGVDPGRAIHVGNSLSSDVAGAKAAGVAAAWLRNTKPGVEEDGPEPDHVIDSMADLPDLCV